jgi:hypothetical protein
MTNQVNFLLLSTRKTMSMTESGQSTQFSESEQKQILDQKISELPWRIKETPVDGLLNVLYDELEKAGISFQPKTYITDSWGCPDKVPIIGVPFYLLDRRACTLISDITDCPMDSDREIMAYLRHEAGHAFNYAYRLYEDPGWQQVFGLFSLPYPEQYKSRPFSTHFVRHIAGWYAQKHPDDDFAETFAVWLTPDSKWLERYCGTPALIKLKYIDELVHRFGHAQPIVDQGDLHRPVEQLDMSLADWCRMAETSFQKIQLPDIIDEDLRRLFPAKEGTNAIDFFSATLRQLNRDVHAWTGLDANLLHLLLQALAKRVSNLSLKVDPLKQGEASISLAIFVATLAMNYQNTETFVEN